MIYIYYANIKRLQEELLKAVDNVPIDLWDSLSQEKAGISFQPLLKLQALQAFESVQKQQRFESDMAFLIQEQRAFITTPAELVYHAYFLHQDPKKHKSLEDYLSVSLNGWEVEVMETLTGLEYSDEYLEEYM